jgi:hypothetical protein
MLRLIERIDADGIRVESGFREDTPRPHIYAYDRYCISRGEAGFHWDDADRCFATLTECAADIEATLHHEANERGFDTDRAFVESAIDPIQGFTRGDRLVIVGAAVAASLTLALVVGLFCLVAL